MAIAVTFLASNPSPGTTSSTITITTTGAGRVVLFVGFETATLPSHQTISGVSGAGATWARRATFNGGGAPSSGQVCDEWYADLPAAVTSQVVTVTFSGTIDAAVLFAVLVSSTTGNAIGYDANADLPISPSNGGTLPGISTDSANPVLLVFNGCASNTGEWNSASVPVLAQLGSNVFESIRLVEAANLFGAVFPGGLSNQSFGGSGSIPTGDIAMIGDALTELGGGQVMIV